MKKIHFYFSILAVCLAFKSQAFTITAGSETYLPELQEPIMQVHKISNDFQFVSFHQFGTNISQTVYVHGYNKGDLSFEEEFWIPQGATSIRDVQLLGDKLAIFYHYAADGISTYSAMLIDKQGQKGELIKLGQIEYNRILRMGRFNHILSPDGSKILLVSQLPIDQVDNANIVIQVFDNELNELRNNQFVLDYESTRGGRNMRLGVSNEGDVAIVMEYIERRNTYLTSFMLANGSDELKENKIELTKGEVLDKAYTMNDDGLFYFAGLIKNDPRLQVGASRARGHFYVRLNPAASEIVVSENETAYEEAGKKVKMIIPGENGELTMLSSVWEENTKTVDERGTRESTFIAGNLYLSEFDASANLIRQVEIKRNYDNSSLSRNQLTVQMTKSNGSYHLIYVEAIEKHFRDYRSAFHHRGNRPLPVHVSIEGDKVQTEPLDKFYYQALKEVDYRLIPASASKNDGDVTFMLARYMPEDKSRYKLIKITY